MTLTHSLEPVNLIIIFYHTYDIHNDNKNNNNNNKINIKQLLPSPFNPSTQ